MHVSKKELIESGGMCGIANLNRRYRGGYKKHLKNSFFFQLLLKKN